MDTSHAPPTEARLLGLFRLEAINTQHSQHSIFPAGSHLFHQDPSLAQEARCTVDGTFAAVCNDQADDEKRIITDLFRADKCAERCCDGDNCAPPN